MRNLASRIGMIGSEGSSIPYQCVEYLKTTSTGGQYINTDIIPSTKMSFVAKVKVDQLVSDMDYSICRSKKDGDTRFGLCGFLAMSAGFAIIMNCKSTKSDLSDRSVKLGKYLISGVEYEIESFISASSFGLIANSETYIQGTNDGSFDTDPYPLYLFASNWVGSLNAVCKGVSIYYAKLYKDDVIVRDFVPVKNNGVGYMYDRVSKTLFGNIGTGAFIVGPDV